MAYRTIVLHADNQPSATERIRIAMELAKQEQAHIAAIGTAIDPHWLRRSADLGNMPPEVEAYFKELEQDARQALDSCGRQAWHYGIDSFEPRLVHGDLVSVLSQRARYADLAILSQPSIAPLRNGNVYNDVPAHVAIQSGAPVLMTPLEGSTFSLGDITLVAWNASIEARRAVQFALPLLQRSREVHVAVVNTEDQHQRYGDDPGADIALYLARQDVRVEVHQIKTRHPIGEALLKLADDLHAELMVMGCYGHGRYRETILGGATRTVIKSATLPVLMVH
jgi:nucleotide-binding universal stress UspA family protein